MQVCVCTHTYAHLPSRDIKPVLQNVHIGYLREVELQKALIFLPGAFRWLGIFGRNQSLLLKTHHSQTTDANFVLPFFPLK